MVHFVIVGGFLKIHKIAFVQEMLVEKSILRTLLNLRSERGLAIQHPSIDDKDGDGMITIHFDTTEEVSLGDDPGQLLGELKKKYRGRVRGRMFCRGWLSSFTIDLESDDDNLQYIM